MNKIKRIILGFLLTSLILASGILAMSCSGKSNEVDTPIVPPPIIDGGSKDEEFQINTDETGIFTAVNQISYVRGGIMRPNYSTGSETGIADKTGIFVEGVTSGASLYYNNIVDVTKCKKDLFAFEGAYSSKYELNKMEVSVIDIYDENNFFTVQWTQNSNINEYSNISVICNGFMGGRDNKTGKVDTIAGTVNWANNFREKIAPNYKHQPFNFRFDVAKNQIFSRVGTGFEYMILDIDDSSNMGDAPLFKGFTTGEVYFKITLSKLGIGKNGGINITTLADFNTDNNIEVEPINCIKLDMNYDYYHNALPCGVVGYQYKLPRAIKTDIIMGKCEVESKLFFVDGETKTNVTTTIKDNSFSPKLGKYLLEFKAKDINGKSVEKNFDIAINATIKDIKIAVKGEQISAYQIFSEVSLPTALASGGQGTLNIETIYKLNDKIVTPNEKGKIYFDCTGKLSINIKVVDYINYSVSFNKDYVVTGSTHLSFEKGLNPAARAGSEITLPDFKAVNYAVSNDDPNHNLPKSIYVNGVKIAENRKYSVPNNVDKLDIVYYGGKGSDTEISKPFTMDVITPQDDTDASGYFITESSVKKEQVAEGIKFSTSTKADKQEIKLPYMISGNYLFFEMINSAEKSGYEFLEYKLTDNLDTQKSVSFRIRNRASGADILALDADGKYSKKVSVKESIASGLSFDFIIDINKKAILNHNYVELIKLDYFDDGSVFTALKSSAVNMSFSFINVVKASEIVVSKIANQSFLANNFRMGDKTGPSIVTKSEMRDRIMSIGSKIVIPASVAFDVLQPYSSVELTVSAPNDKTLFDKADISEDKTIELNSYGNYYILLEGKDSLGNVSTKNYFITVNDEIAPIIEVDSSLKPTYSVGKSIIIPQAKFSDNNDSLKDLVIKIFVIDTKLTYNIVKSGDTFAFAAAGKYQVVFYVRDKAYNVTRVTINIAVTK